MTTHPAAALVLGVAKARLGELERPPHSNLHSSVEWYNAHVSNLGRAWNYCAAGVSRDFLSTAAKDLITPRAYVPWMIGDFAAGKHGSSLIWITNDLSAARPGDVVFFDWDKSSTRRSSFEQCDHVGLLEGLIDRDTASTIEDNTSVPGTGNEGTARKARDARYIVALGRPNWNAVKLPTTTTGRVRTLFLTRPQLHGSDVLRYQRAFNLVSAKTYGRRLVEDGYFGPATDAATRWMQARYGLVVDGKLGPASRARFRKLGYRGI